MKIAPFHSQPGNGNSGIVPPWLLPTPVVPLPGPVDDEFHILPIDLGDAAVGASLVLSKV